MAALAVSAALCLALASLTYGTNDVLFFQSYAVTAARDGATALYRHGAPLVAWHPKSVEPMAHPPAMLTLWTAVQYAQNVSGVPFRFWFRVLTTLAFLASAVLVWRLANAKAAIYYALCPTAIMISGFHGNSDPLVVAMVLTAVYAAECRHRPGWAGVCYGIACSIKVWPLFLVVAFMFGLKTGRDRLRFGVLAVATAAALAFPYILADPALILSKVFSYRSDSGRWGLSQWPAYVPIGVPLAFLAVVATAIYLRKREASLTCLVGWSILLFLVLTPGFGIQYLAWILPFCFLFGGRVTAAVYAISSVFLASLYTYLSGGLPWYFADMLITRAGSPAITYFAELCWLTLAVSAVTSLRSAHPRMPA